MYFNKNTKSKIMHIFPSVLYNLIAFNTSMTEKEYYLWKCEECGQFVTSPNVPLELKWEDGHICKFKRLNRS